MPMTKLRKYFRFIIPISALLVSVIGSYYSIYGIGRIFAGHQTGATFMAFALEFGNIVTASSLKLYWNELPKLLRGYLCSAVVVLSIITSIGIYGFLSDGYQMTYNKDRIVESRIELVKKKKERFEIQLVDYKKEREEINNSVSNLRKSLATDNQYQTVDKRGNVLTQIQSTSKKGVQSELSNSTSRSAELSTKIDNLNDSISVYDLRIIEIQASNDVSVELGALKYISSLTGSSMNVVVNWFLVLLMLVFQPLAIALILTSLFAFSVPEEVKETPAPDVTVLTEEEAPLPLEKKKRKSRQKKVLDETEMEYPKTFDIKIEGLDIPGDTFEELPEPPVAIPAKTDSKPKRRKVVVRDLTEDLDKHLSDSLSKKKH